MRWHVPIFCLHIFYGTIIAMDSFWSLVKILCNFGSANQNKRRKEKGKRRKEKGERKKEKGERQTILVPLPGGSR
jgi:hypothetical protein